MIPNKSKFPMRTDFLRFRSRAKRFATPHLTILSSPSSDLSAIRSEAKDRSELSVPSRLSVVIPKKVSKLATTRNWLKRLVYDMVWPNIQNKKVDCIVVFKPLPLSRSAATKEVLIKELSLIGLTDKLTTDN